MSAKSGLTLLDTISMHGASQELSDAFSCLRDGAVVQVRITRRRGDLGMPEQLANYWQDFGLTGGEAGEAMPKVMQPHVWKRSVLAQLAWAASSSSGATA